MDDSTDQVDPRSKNIADKTPQTPPSTPPAMDGEPGVPNFTNAEDEATRLQVLTTGVRDQDELERDIGRQVRQQSKHGRVGQ